MTKKELEAQLAELKASQGTASPEPKRSKVSIPAFAASSPSEVIGVASYGGNGNYRVVVAARDGESQAPKPSEKSGYGIAKARPLTPETIAWILDNESSARKLIATCEKLNG